MFGEKSYKYLTAIAVIFVAVLMISNIVSTKIVDIKGLVFDGGTILFPLAYIMGDILTEVYGFKRARRIIWLGFFSLLLMSSTIYVVGLLPSADFWTLQEDYNNILGYAPRIIMGSLIAYMIGEFANSYILSKMKVKMKGKMLPLRTIASTIVGQGLDTVIFVLIAFYGIFSTEELIAIIVANYIIKVAIEFVFTPLTVYVVNKLKKAENEDYYDKKGDFKLV